MKSSVIFLMISGGIVVNWIIWHQALIFQKSSFYLLQRKSFISTFGQKVKQLDEKVKFNLKIHDVTTQETNNYLKNLTK